MNLALAITKLREIADQNKRIKNPDTEAQAKLNKIYTELKALCESNSESSSRGLRVIYNEIASNRLTKMFKHLSYYSDREEIRQELIAQGEVSIYETSSQLVDVPVIKDNELNLGVAYSADMHRFVLTGVLDYVYNKICATEKEYDDMIAARAELEPLIEAYNYLNHKNLYYSAEKFRNAVAAGSPTVRNLTDIMAEVIKSFRNNRPRFQQLLDEARETHRAASRRKLQAMMDNLSEDTTTFYQQITIGSESAQSYKVSSFICGNCEIENPLEAPVLQTNTQVFVRRMERNDVQGYLRIGINQCPHCGKYNILPASFIKSIEDVLLERNNDLSTHVKAKKEGNTLALGIGIVDAAREKMLNVIENDETELTRENYRADYESLPTFVNAGFKAITTFQLIDLGNNGKNFNQIVDSTLEDMLDLMQDENEPAVAPMTSVWGNETYDDDMNVVADDTPLDIANLRITDVAETTRIQEICDVYKERLDVRGHEVRLKPSRMLVGFTKILLQNSNKLGYSQLDLLKSICSPASHVYPLMKQYRSMVSLKYAMEKLRILIDSMGCMWGNGYHITTARFSAYYTGMLRMEYTLYDCLGDEYPMLSQITANLNLENLASEDMPVIAEAQYNELIAEIDVIRTPSEVKTVAKAKAREYCDALAKFDCGYTSKVYSGKTLVLHAMCSKALELLKVKMESLEREILKSIIWGASEYNQIIDVSTYSESVKSPLYVLPMRLMQAAVEEVYYPMLRNTLTKSNLVSMYNFNLQDSESSKYNNYNRSFKRMIGVMSSPRVNSATKLLFGNLLSQNLDVYKTHSGVRNEWIEIDPAISVSKLKYGIKDVMIREEDVYSKFSKLVIDSFCDAINCVTDFQTLRALTYMNQEVIDLTINNIDFDFRHNQLISLIYELPEISSCIKSDLLGYIYTHPNLNQDDLIAFDDADVSIWDSSELDSDADDDVRIRKIDALTNLLAFYGEFLTEQERKSVEIDLEKYESEE